MRLPNEAKSVFKGIIYSVYQWEQEQFDGSYKTFEMLKRADTVLVIAAHKGKILLAEQEQPGKPPFTSILGGRQENDEMPLDTAKRELLEESGMVSDDWELYHACEPVTKMEWKVYFFLARDCKKIQEQQLDPGERITITSVTFDEFIRQIKSNDIWDRELATHVLKMGEKQLKEFERKIFPPHSS